MTRDVSPCHRRKLARYQHSYWRWCARWNMPSALPVQLYKHLRRINLPRMPRVRP